MTKYRALVYADGSCTLLEKKRWMWREVTIMTDSLDPMCVLRRWPSLEAAKAEIQKWHREDAAEDLRHQYIKTVELGEFKP